MLTTKNVARIVVCTVLLGSSLTMIGCKKKEKGTAIGALLGAGVGAGVGAAVGDGTGALIGGGVGAVTGAVIGNAVTDEDNK